MKVYCLIPVHNRLEDTKALLSDLQQQDVRELQIVVVDDGSTDGTGDYLRQYVPEAEVLHGDGTLWWGGAMARGLAHILRDAQNDDYVLFLNNDLRVAPDLVQRLVHTSRQQGGAIVGSLLMSSVEPNQLLSIGPRIRYVLARVEEIHLDGGGVEALAPTIDVDALSGRGTLYPVETLRRIGSIRARLLPHYMGDYEISARAKRRGVPTVVCRDARVRSAPEWSGIDPGQASLLARLFSRRSRSNLIDAIMFFSLCGPWYLRATGWMRVLAVRSWSGAKRIVSHGSRESRRERHRAVRTRSLR